MYMLDLIRMNLNLFFPFFVVSITVHMAHHAGGQRAVIILEDEC